jgi:hypothetical protein
VTLGPQPDPGGGPRRGRCVRCLGVPRVALFDVLAMVLMLVESARAHRWAITTARSTPLVYAGAHFENGILIARPEAAA